MSRPGPARPGRCRPWRIEPVLKPEPDLGHLTQLFAALAIDRAKNSPPNQAATSAGRPIPR